MRYAVILLIAALGALACESPGGGSSSPRAPAVEFKDLQGNSHSLASLDKPAVVGFWISNCGYCRNMLGILNSVIAKNRDGADVYGIYLNDVPESEISGAAAEENFSGIAAAAQQRVEVIKTFHETFGIRGPGRDVYVIDRSGAFRSVSLVDGAGQLLPQADVEAKLQELIDRDAGRPTVPSAGGKEESLID